MGGITNNEVNETLSSKGKPGHELLQRGIVEQFLQEASLFGYP